MLPTIKTSPAFLIVCFIGSLNSWAQNADPKSFIGDTLFIKDNQFTKVAGYEGFIKDHNKVSDYDFYLNGSKDPNVLLNDGKGKTPYDQLKGKYFLCTNVIPFGKSGKNSFLELKSDEFGTVFYKFSGISKVTYPFFEKEERKMFLSQRRYEAEKVRNAPPKDYCKILFYESGKSIANKLPPAEKAKYGSKYDNIEVYHSSEILPVILHVQKGNFTGDKAARFYSAEVQVLSKYDHKGEDVIITLSDGSKITGKAATDNVTRKVNKDNSFEHQGRIEITKENFALMTKNKVTSVKFHLHENDVTEEQAKEIMEYAKCIYAK